MTVSEVREVMRRMWAQNSALLRLLFAQDPKLSVMGSVNVQQPKARDFEQAFNMFFLQVIPVAPNRVRPVSIMNDQSFEHPHNVALTRVGSPLPCYCSALYSGIAEGLLGVVQGLVCAEMLDITIQPCHSKAAHVSVQGHILRAALCLGAPNVRLQKSEEYGEFGNLG